MFSASFVQLCIVVICLLLTMCDRLVSGFNIQVGNINTVSVVDVKRPVVLILDIKFVRDHQLN